jgi:hypothetical protein
MLPKERKVPFVIIVFLFLTIFARRSSAQLNNSTSSQSKTGEASTVAVFAGCYQLTLGHWWPWSFGGDTKYVTPPNHIELLPERGTEGLEKEGFVIRAILATTSRTSGRGGPSYWQVKSESQIDLMWNDGFTGVTLKLEKHGDELRGWAHPHFDGPTFVPRIARVTARRITCGTAQ